MSSSQPVAATNSVSDIIQQVTTAWKTDVPLPSTTPFDASPDSRTTYLEAYRDGYRSGLTSLNVEFRLPASSDTARWRGWQDGAAAGSKVVSKKQS